MIKKKMVIVVIVGTRGFFNPYLALSGRKDILSVLDTDAAPTGVVEL